MQTSNHFQWMSTKGAEKSPLIPYPNAQEAHQRFLAALDELQAEMIEQQPEPVGSNQEAD
jgi:hypothetical protein